MSQEYTEDKYIKFKSLSSGRRLLEAILLAIVLAAIFLIVALVSFNPSDPSWSQTTWNEPVKNLAGSIGSWSADILFSAFGMLAFTIPPLLILGCWRIYRYHSNRRFVDFFSLSLRLIGALALILTSCGLAELNSDEIPNFASGGVIGSVFSDALMAWFNPLGATLSLICLWAIGFTLLTGWSWLTIAEKIGAIILVPLTLLTNRARGDEEDDGYYEDDGHEADQHQVEQYEGDYQQQTNNDEDHELDPLIQPTFSDENHYQRPIESDYQDIDDVLFSSPPISELAKAEQFSLTDIGQLQSGMTTQIAATIPQPTAAIDSAVTMENRQQQPQIQAPVPSMPEQLSPFSTHADATHTETKVEAYRFDTPDTYQSNYPNVPDIAASDRRFEPSTVATENQPETRINELDTSQTDSSQYSSELMKRETALIAAGISVASLERHSQVKQGIGPELPRPNPVRLPTRRERYGVHIQSEVQRRKEEVEQQREHTDKELTNDNELQQQAIEQEAELRQQFLKQQQQRYGDESDSGNDDYHYQRSNIAEPTNNPIEYQTRIETGLTQPEIIHRWPDAGRDIPSQSETPDYYSVISASDEQSRPSQARDEVIYTQSHDQQPVEHHPQHEPQSQPPQIEPQDTLFHPFLVRNDQPLPKSTTPMPSLDLLASPPSQAEPVDMFALEQTSRLIEARLSDYRVKADVVGFSPGPVITRFELDLAPGVKAARISNLSRDLARSLSATAVRIVEVIPGKPYVGLELPNQKRQTVYLREVLDCDQFRNDPSPLTIVLGKDIEGEPVVADLGKMPHLLVAGTTGSGKSVGVNAMILSILYKSKPEDVRFIMIDPKMLELSIYEGIPHLLTEVVTDMKDAANALRWCVNEMERRYKLMSALGVRNLAGYNDRIKDADIMGRPIPHPFWKPGDTMDIEHPVLQKEPYIVVMVDEFADLMMTAGKKVEELIARLAQKARAAGIHLVLATQRPSVDIITGLIKANIPTRIAFTVSSKIDSRTILDQSGAESLLGMGDMLYLPPNSSIPIRVHGAFVRDQEVHDVVNDWKARGKPQYIDNIVKCSDESEGGGGNDSGAEELDPLFDQAVEFVIEKQRVSISGVQRQFRIGYNRAARIVEQMEAQSIVSEPGHNGNREVLPQQPMGH